MEKLRTHYDNLQVAENASSEVIKGAYRYLSQKWHPDKNPDNRQAAERIITIINEAYHILSDPERRRQHDIWISEHRAKHENNASRPSPHSNASLNDDGLYSKNQKTQPALWNPSAAANWSILLSPIFGAWLHAKNWIVLGEVERSRKSMRWVYSYAIFLVASLFLPERIGPGAAFWILIIWYFLSGRPQAKYVKERFGENYTRKGWWKPLGTVLLLIFALIGVAGVLLALFDPQV